MSDLPVNIDTAYDDDSIRPGTKLHQQHHDVLHAFYNNHRNSPDSPAEILAALLTVDGPGSGLDADTLDGFDSTYFATDGDIAALYTYINALPPSNLTPAQILAALLTVDGTGSLLDADKLDGLDSTHFATAADLAALQSQVNNLNVSSGLDWMEIAP